MRFKIVLALLVLLVGCQSLKGNTKEISDTIWGYNFDQNEASGPVSGVFRTSTRSKDGVYFRMILETKTSEGDNQSHVLGYVGKNTNEAVIVNSNVDSTCSIENPEPCSSFSENYGQPLQYYNEKLYIIDNVYDVNSNKTSIQLMEMDLDGNNRRHVHTIMNTLPATYNLEVIFHRGYFYYTTLQNSTVINKVNMSTWESEEIELEGKVTFMSLLRIEEDILYLNPETYQFKDKQYLHPLIGLNVNTHDVEIEELGLPLYQKYKDYYVYYDDDKNTTNLHQSSNDYHTTLLEGSTTGIFMDDKFILFSFERSDGDIFLYDWNGNLLDKYQSTEGPIRSWAQVYHDGYLYAYRFEEDDYTSYLRFDLKDNKFLEPEIMMTWAGY